MQFRPYIAMLLLGLPLAPACWALDPSKELRQYRLNHWSNGEGLSQNNVEWLTQTKEGFLWVSTHEGIGRYDGTSWKNYRNFLPEPYRRTAGAMLGLLDGRLLVVGRPGPPILIDHDVVVTLPGVASLELNDTQALAQTQDGAIWFASPKGLQRWQEGHLTDGAFPKIGVNELVSAGDVLWAASDNGLWRRSAGTWRLTPGSEGRKIIAATATRGGAVWAIEAGEHILEGSAAGVGRAEWDDVLRSIRPLRHILVDRNESLWITAGREHLIRRTESGKVRIFNREDGVALGPSTAIMEDLWGGIWIPMSPGGLLQIRDSRFLNITAAEGFVDDAVWTVAEDAEGRIWAGTEASGFLRHTVEGWKHILLPGGPPNGRVYSMLPTAGGAVWLSAGKSLFRWESGHTAKIREFPDGSRVNSLALDTQGRLWVAMRNTGIWMGTGEGDKWTFENMFPSIPARVTRVLLASRSGAMWIGSRDYGLAVWERGRFRSLPMPELDGLTIESMMEDSRGVIWAGTFEHGLLRIEDDRVTRIDPSHGIQALGMHAVLEDSRHYVWMTSNSGLYRASIDDLDRAALRGERIMPRRYGVGDGLRTPEFQGGMTPAGIIGSDGSLWLPLISGITRVDTAIRQTGPNVALPYLETVSAGPEKYTGEAARHVQLISARDRLEISFSTPYLAGRLPVQYRLKGVDPDWVPARAPFDASYINVPHGEHSFEVRVAGEDTSWKDPVQLLTLSVPAPYYQRPLFILFGIVVLGGLVAAVWRFRLRQLRQRNAELHAAVEERTEELRKVAEAAQAAGIAKQQFLATMSHELRTPLNVVLGLAQELAAMRLPEPARENAELIQQSGRALLELIGDVLDFSRIEAGRIDLREEDVDIRLCMEECVEMTGWRTHGKPLEVCVVVDPAANLIIRGDQTRIRQVVQNLVDNAVKFTAAGSVTVRASVRQEDEHGEKTEYLEIRVRDTGIGFPMEKKERLFGYFEQADASSTRRYGGSGLGLAICKRLTQAMGGGIDAVSTPGKGSEFRAWIRLHRASQSLPPTPQLPCAEVEIHTVSDCVGDSLRSLCEAFGLAISPSACMVIEEAEEKVVVRGTKECSIWKPVRRQSLEMAIREAGGAPLLKSPEIHKPDRSALIGMRVLLVEDNGTNRLVARRMLERLGCIVTVAANGMEGIDAAVADPTIEVILMDIQMPVLDGLAATTEIIRRLGDARPRIIALTANAFEQDREACLGAGMNGYLSKPIVESRLVEALSSGSLSRL